MVWNAVRTTSYGPFWVNTYVVYTCHPGYELIGSAHLTCYSNGQWSADIPFCQRNLGKNQQM